MSLIKNTAGKEIRGLLTKFGYTEEWLHKGVVDDDFLVEQERTFSLGEDRNLEHYRHQAFLRFLAKRDRVSNGDVSDILSLKDQGSDGVDLSRERLMSLIESRLLSEMQLSSLLTLRVVEEFIPAKKAGFRVLVEMAISKRGLTKDLLELIRGSQDTFLQTVALDANVKDHAFLEWLSVNGGNKGVRNRARQKLMRK